MDQVPDLFGVLSDVLHTIWHYPILNVGKESIRVSNVALAAAIFTVGLKYSKKLSLRFKNYLHHTMEHDKDTANALEKIVSYAGLVVFAIIVLEIANVPLSTFAFVGGALALGIGLGGQNLMNNFISSLIIMIERPIKMGDIVEFDGVVGAVTDIGGRCITITTFSNVEVLIPNSKLMQEILVNWTLGDHVLRGKAVVRIDKSFYDNAKKTKNSPAKTIKDLVAALKSTPHIIGSPQPSAYLLGVDEHYYNYEIHFNCDISDMKALELVQSNVNIEIADLLAGTDFVIEHLKLVAVDSHQSSKGA